MTTKTPSKNTALIIIDVQQAIDQFSDQPRNNPNAEQNMALILGEWRLRGWPVVHVRHASKFEQSPYHTESQYFGFKPEVLPLSHEKMITKSENCAFVNTELDAYLKSIGVSEIVLCGVLTNNSVDATARVGAALGYSQWFVEDAMAAFAMDLMNGIQLSAEDVHWTFLTNLQGEYGTVINSETIISHKLE